jgi:electron transfer flavoprotein beta subunit
MIIVVCVKQIMDPEVPPPLFRIDLEKKQAVKMSGVEMVMSPFDEQAVEAAVQLKEAHETPEEVSVILFSLGTPDAKDMLKHGLSMGADQAVLISSADFDVSDSFSTAAVLVTAIKNQCRPDLILTGRQAADFDIGVVGIGIGELFNWPIISWAKALSTKSGSVTVERVLSDGSDIVECDLPVVVSIANEFGAPRKPSLRETMKSARKPLTELKKETLHQDLSATDYLPKQATVDLFAPERINNCQMIEGVSPSEIAANLVLEIKATKLI